MSRTHGCVERWLFSVQKQLFALTIFSVEAHFGSSRNGCPEPSNLRQRQYPNPAAAESQARHGGVLRPKIGIGTPAAASAWLRCYRCARDLAWFMGGSYRYR